MRKDVGKMNGQKYREMYIERKILWRTEQIEVPTCQNRRLGSSVDRALVSHLTSKGLTFDPHWWQIRSIHLLLKRWPQRDLIHHTIHHTLATPADVHWTTSRRPRQLRYPAAGQLHYPSGQLHHPTTHHHHLVSLSSSSLEAWGGAVWRIEQIEVPTCLNRRLGSSVDRALVSHFDIQRSVVRIPVVPN